jgi:hypothetical protein
MNDLLANVLAITIRGIHSLSPLSKRPTMSSDDDSNADVMAFFLVPGHRTDTHSFVTNYYRAAKSSTNPEHSLLDRQLVTDFGVNKDPEGPLHESFYANVFDKDTLEKHVVVIDRTASNRSISHEDTFKSFSQFPESKGILETIDDALKDLPSNILASASTGSADESKTPLLNNASGSPTSTLSRAFSQAVAAARSTSQSSSVGIEADDLITVVKNQDLGQSMRQYLPSGLPLFAVLLVALVVHLKAPAYALFESQCYWYANIIFDVLCQVFPSAMIPAPSPSPRILLPIDYLPKEAGRWKGVLINDPRVVAAVVSIVKSDFKEKYGKYVKKVKKVKFLINSGLLVAKYPKDNASSDGTSINGLETSRVKWQCKTHDFFSYHYWSIVFMNVLNCSMIYLQIPELETYLYLPFPLRQRV